VLSIVGFVILMYYKIMLNLKGEHEHLSDDVSCNVLTFTVTCHVYIYTYTHTFRPMQSWMYTVDNEHLGGGGGGGVWGGQHKKNLNCKKHKKKKGEVW
jgi:hypothetical protein